MFVPEPEERTAQGGCGCLGCLLACCAPVIIAVVWYAGLKYLGFF